MLAQPGLPMPQVWLALRPQPQAARLQRPALAPRRTLRELQPLVAQLVGPLRPAALRQAAV
jgi:hypothetical protein